MIDKTVNRYKKKLDKIFSLLEEKAHHVICPVIPEGFVASHLVTERYKNLKCIPLSFDDKYVLEQIMLLVKEISDHDNVHFHILNRNVSLENYLKSQFYILKENNDNVKFTIHCI